MVKTVPGQAGVNARCASVKKAIEKASSCPDRVKQMLTKTLPLTAGTPKADRFPFSDRFVAMIEEVLETERTRLSQDATAKEAHLTDLTPAKTTREEDLAQKKAVTAEKATAVAEAKTAVTDATAAAKAAVAALSEAKKAQKSGDEEVEGIMGKKSMLEAGQTKLASLVDSNPEDKPACVSDVLGLGKSFGFDSSLMTTAAQVLERDAAERGAFDATCLDQLKGAFGSAIAKLDEEIAVHAPAKAERAAAVEQAEAAKTAADASLEDLKAKLTAAKDAKATADAEQKAAAKTLADFIPDLKAAGDSLDDAKKAIKSFDDGAGTAIKELKDFAAGDFVKKSYYQTIDGMRCDREVIDICREAESPSSATPGRVSVEDAQKVYEKIADGNKETRSERWTLRYCLAEFKWSEAAHDWIIEELKKVPQEDPPAKKSKTGKSYTQQIDGVKCDRAIVDVCHEAEAAHEDGRLSEEDAKKVWAKAVDANKVTQTEKWTLRYCLSAFKWNRAAHDFVLDELHAVDKKGRPRAQA